MNHLDFDEPGAGYSGKCFSALPENPFKVINWPSNGFEHSGEKYCGVMSLFQLHTSPDLAAELQLQHPTSLVDVYLTQIFAYSEKHPFHGIASGDGCLGHVEHKALR